jgi:hypothetical protein
MVNQDLKVMLGFMDVFVILCFIATIIIVPMMPGSQVAYFLEGGTLVSSVYFLLFMLTRSRITSD